MLKLGETLDTKMVDTIMDDVFGDKLRLYLSAFALTSMFVLYTCTYAPVTVSLGWSIGLAFLVAYNAWSKNVRTVFSEIEQRWPQYAPRFKWEIYWLLKERRGYGYTLITVFPLLAMLPVVALLKLYPELADLARGHLYITLLYPAVVILAMIFVDGVVITAIKTEMATRSVRRL